MIASLIAYAFCLFLLAIAGSALVGSFDRKEHINNRMVDLLLTLVFGLTSWGFAYLGGLS